MAEQGLEVDVDQVGEGQEESRRMEQVGEQAELTVKDQEAYHNIMDSLSKMKDKISLAKKKLIPHSTPETASSDLASKLIKSKENSEIITKENLLMDITESYEKVVVEVYSQNQRLKKKIEEMAKIIKEQSNKLYEHLQLEDHLKKENQSLKTAMVQMKDEKTVVTRKVDVKEHREEPKKKNVAGVNQDFDFWSMPQNDSYGKKPNVGNSALWVNQKDIGESVFLTEGIGKKK